MYNYKEYWESNIDSWAKFYSDKENSEENFQSNGLVRSAYKFFIIPIENKLMAKRHHIVKQLIALNLKKDELVVDVGCGSGIYSVLCLKYGAKVLAIDFAQSAINATVNTVHLSEFDKKPNINYQKADITNIELPKSHMVLMIGVSPYLTSLNFIQKMCMNTNVVIFHYLSSTNILNRIRLGFSFLNVRKVNTFQKKLVGKLFNEANFIRTQRIPIGTGFIEVFSRNEQEI